MILRLKNFVVHFSLVFISALHIRVLIFTIMTFFRNNYETIWVYNKIMKGRDPNGAWISNKIAPFNK